MKPVAVAAAVIVADQLTKIGSPPENAEFALGAFSFDRWLMVTAMIAVAVWVACTSRARARFGPVLLAVFLAAVASNTFDRIVHGAVRDPFIIRRLAFNLADLAILATVTVAVLYPQTRKEVHT